MGIRTDAIPDVRVRGRRFSRRSILLLDRHAYTPHGGRRCTAVNLVMSAIPNAWHKVNACGMQLFPRRQFDRSILMSVPAATWTTRLFWRTVQPGEITCRRESGSEKMKVTLRLRPARFVRDSTQLLSNCPFWMSSDLSRKKKRLVQCSYGRLPSLLWMMEAKHKSCPEAEHKFRINVSHL